MVSARQLSASAMLVMALAVSWTPVGEAIKCYDCNSHNDSRCANAQLPEIMMKDCTNLIEGKKYILCRKIVQHIDFEVNGNKPEQRVIRSCGWDNSSYVNRCYQRSGFGGRQDVCSCTDDYCNSAPNMPLLPGLSLAAITTALYRLVF